MPTRKEFERMYPPGQEYIFSGTADGGTMAGIAYYLAQLGVEVTVRNALAPEHGQKAADIVTHGNLLSYVHAHGKRPDHEYAAKISGMIWGKVLLATTYEQNGLTLYKHNAADPHSGYVSTRSLADMFARIDAAQGKVSLREDLDPTPPVHIGLGEDTLNLLRGVVEEHLLKLQEDQ